MSDRKSVDKIYNVTNMGHQAMMQLINLISTAEQIAASCDDIMQHIRKGPPTSPFGTATIRVCVSASLTGECLDNVAIQMDTDVLLRALQKNSDLFKSRSAKPNQLMFQLADQLETSMVDSGLVRRPPPEGQHD